MDTWTTWTWTWTWTWNMDMDDMDGHGCVQVSWDKPSQLQTAEERQVDTSDCVWLPSEQEAT